MEQLPLTPDQQTPPMAAAAPPPRRFRRLKTVLVFAFVSLHLTFLVVRNTLDLAQFPEDSWPRRQSWWPAVDDVGKKADAWTLDYQRWTTVDQQWSMFSPPVWRYAPFLAMRIEFTDGSSDVLLSENEPADPCNYWRPGETKLRRFEAVLMSPPNDLTNSPRLPLWQAYLRWRLRVWRERHPDDERVPIRLELVRRELRFPGPESMPGAFAPVDEKVIATFRADDQAPK